jgi:hypothetical protein
MTYHGGRSDSIDHFQAKKHRAAIQAASSSKEFHFSEFFV